MTSTRTARSLLRASWSLAACCAVLMLVALGQAQQQPGNSNSLPPSVSSGGSQGFASQQVLFAAAGTITVTHNLGLSAPYYPALGQVITYSGCAFSACGSIGNLTTNTFDVTSTMAANWIIPYAFVTAPPGDFTVSVSDTTTSVFQSGVSGVSSAIYTVTQAQSPGVPTYAGTTTLSCPSAPTGITCSFSPSTITGTGTSTLTVWASYSASASTSGTSNAFTVQASDGTRTHSVASNPLTVWTGPVSQWLMNEGASPMADTSGHTNNLTNTGVTYTNISGLLANTVTYNGTSSGSAAATSSGMSFASAYTVCQWENSSSWAADWDVGANASVSTYNWILGSITASTPKQPMFWMQSDGSHNVNIYFSYTLALSTTYQFCVSTSGSGTAAGVIGYINGAAVSQANVASNNFVSGNPGSPTMVISGSSAGYTHYGGIADIRIYAYALSATQIAALYSGGVK